MTGSRIGPHSGERLARMVASAMEIPYALIAAGPLDDTITAADRDDLANWPTDDDGIPR